MYFLLKLGQHVEGYATPFDQLALSQRNMRHMRHDRSDLQETNLLIRRDHWIFQFDFLEARPRRRVHRHCKSINPSNCANLIELALDNWITSMDLHSQLSPLIALSSRKSNRFHLGMRLLIFHAGSNCRSEKGTGCFVKLRKSGIDSLRFPPSEGISISHTFTYSVQIPIYIYPSM